jgi:hypothetical protein
MGRAEATEAFDLRGDHQVGSDPLLQDQHLSLPLRRLPGSALRNRRVLRITPTLPERREKTGRRLTETAGPRIYGCDAVVYLPPSRPNAPRIFLAPPRAELSAPAHPCGRRRCRLGSERCRKRRGRPGRLLVVNSILRALRREEMFVGNQALPYD